MTVDNRTVAQNSELFRRAMQDVFVDHDLAAIDQYYADDLIQHSDGVPEGAEGLKGYFAGLFEAFPDLEPTIEHLHAVDDRVFAFLTWRGTHEGEFMSVEATGEEITIETAELMRVEDGAFTEHWDVVDQLEMLATLGLVTINEPQLG